MASWADVKFIEPPRYRRVQDFFPIIIDIVMLCDFLVCLVCGETARAYVCSGDAAEGYSFGTTFFSVAVDSLIVAWVLRYPIALKSKNGDAVLCCVRYAEMRCLFGFLVVTTGWLTTESGKTQGLAWLFVWYIVFALSLKATRLCLGSYFKWLRQRGALREAVAIVGAAGPGERLAARIPDEADIVGIYAAQPADAPERLGQDDTMQLLELGRAGNLDSVVVAAGGGGQSGSVAELVERLKALPVQVAVCADDDLSQQDEAALRILCGVPVAVVADGPINRHGLLMKTLCDKCTALVLLVAFAPLMLGLALAVGVSSEGPIIFRQTRQGWCGRQFTVYKFRTMRMPPKGLAWMHQTQRNDFRCTRVGRVLRRTSLDELPQLWNVLCGDMSMVGPRPHDDNLHDLDRAGRELVAEYAQRYRVKPGMTGWAQIHGSRGPTCSVEQLRRRVAYDLYYIENWSPWLDMQILARTPLCLVGENVY